jgi:hypothetical protein
LQVAIHKYINIRVARSIGIVPIKFCLVIPKIFAIVNVTDMIPKDTDAKESQILNDAHARFVDNIGHCILLGTRTKMISYYMETSTRNLSRVSSSIPDNDTHMSTIAKESNNKKYIVTISWDSQELKPGQNTLFLVSFFDLKTQVEMKQIDYSLNVFSSLTSTIVKNAVHQKAPNGTGAQIVDFPGAGKADISLNITKYGSRTRSVTNTSNINTNGTESVTFPVLISP